MDDSELTKVFKPTDDEVAQARKTLRHLGDLSLDGDSDSMIPQLYVLAYNPVDGTSGVQLFALVVDFDTALEKQSILFKLGQKIFKDELVPKLAGLVSECWRSFEKDGEPRKYLCPGDDPNRQEAIQAAVLCLGGRCTHDARIVRRENGNMVPDAEWESSDADKCTSPLLERFFRGFFSGVRHVAEQA